MEKYFSKIEPKILLHLVNRLKDIDGRANITDEKESLQLATFKLNSGHTFKPHKHIYFEKTITTTQESWIVIKGSIKCIYYDLNDEFLDEVILKAGDCSITFRGGHTFVSLEDNTIVYENKNGPYLGKIYDSILINN